MVVFEIQNLNGITVWFLLPGPFFFLKYVFMAWSFPFHATMHDVRQITICSITHHHYFECTVCTLDTRFQIRSLDCLCFVVSAARSENEKKTEETVLF